MTRWEKFLCAIGVHEWCHYWSLIERFRQCNRCEKLEETY